MADNIIHVTDADFDEKVLKADRPVIVDFWAPWCGPCRMVAPVLEQLAEERPDEIIVAKLNTDENQMTAGQFGIMSIPTIIIFNNGEAVEGTVGAVPYGPMSEWIDNLLSEFAQQTA